MAVLLSFKLTFKLLAKDASIKSINHGRFYGSFLYVSRTNDSKKVPSILPPQVNYIFHPNHLDRIKDSVAARGQLNFCFDTIANQWKQYSNLKQECEALEKLKQKWTLQIQQQSSENGNMGIENELKKEARNVKETQKLTMTKLIQIEKTLIPTILKLPNVLHSSVPAGDYRVRYESSTRKPNFDFTPKTHVQLGIALKELMFSPYMSHSYYLLGRLADLELATLDYFADFFTRNDFVRFSNPDICKSLIVEGCGEDVKDQFASFQLQEQEGKLTIATQHLKGGASLPAFCAYFSKNIVKNDDFKSLKLFTTARNYSPSKESSQTLFDPRQSSQLYFFIPNYKDESSEFEKTVTILKDCFDEMKVHYRMVDINAERLSPAESRRTEIQMWSVSTESYHTVSHVSDYDDYIAKRIWMLRKDKDKYQFINVISGCAVSFPQLAACIMENNQTSDGNYTVPNVLQPKMFRTYIN